jgi:hypothetical protein
MLNTEEIVDIATHYYLKNPFGPNDDLKSALMCILGPKESLRNIWALLRLNQST